MPEETVFFFTINNVDKSTEDLDDALFGRLRAIDFPPRIEALTGILTAGGINTSTQLGLGLLTFFQRLQAHYPLGHGYFAGLTASSDMPLYYMTAIRPLLANHFAAYQPTTLNEIDTLFDECVVRLLP
ncbi:hypothetical protein ASG96_18960 [Terrabacter sp. Soil810]|nr:hypothetical protein ASG96_18960 [Terrabacter sp. Soil810]